MDFPPGPVWTCVPRDFTVRSSLVVTSKPKQIRVSPKRPEHKKNGQENTGTTKITISEILGLKHRVREMTKRVRSPNKVRK